MATLATFQKQPHEVLAYDVAFVDWLAGVNDTGVSCTAVADAGVTQPSVAVLSAGIVRVWIAGGTSGQSYHVTVTLTTASTPTARVREADFTIKVKEL